MLLVGTFIAAIDLLPQHNTMSADLAVAVSTTRRKRSHRAFKAVEDVGFTAKPDFKALRILVPTNFTPGIIRHILEVIHKHPHILQFQRERDFEFPWHLVKNYLALLRADCAFLIF